MIGTLKEQRQMLKELWVSRKGQLEQRFQFNVFKQDTEKVSFGEFSLQSWWL